jgi:hypothetical protein
MKKYNGNHKKLFTFISIFLLSLMSLQCTGQNRIKERIKSNRIAFMSERLDLSEAEAQKFWPIYNDYQSEKAVILNKQNMKFEENMTDAQADKLMEEVLVLRSKEIELQRKYIAKMKGAIPSRKVAKVFRLEREYQGELLSRVKNRARNN